MAKWTCWPSFRHGTLITGLFALFLVSPVHSGSAGDEGSTVPVIPAPEKPRESGVVEPAGPGAPLTGEMRITGTFGEPRSRHLHTGLDLSTGGETGAPVLAVGDGSVVRMRAGASGYGRALYLRTDEGYLAVYGHLEKFAPSLENYLRRKQRERGEYEINLILSPDEFRFSRGDTIAHSGATGAGPPHLHFELRDGDYPINPQLNGIRPTDKSAPDITTLILRPLAADAYADGYRSAVAGTAVDHETVVWGLIGVEAGIIDHCGLTDNRLTPLRMNLYLDDSLIYARSFERLDFSRGAEVWRIYGRRPQGERIWRYRLYRWPFAGEADLTDQLAGNGVIDFALLPAGLHEFKLVVIDAAGHSSTCRWPVNSQPPLVVRDCSAEFPGDQQWRLELVMDVPHECEQLPPWVKWQTDYNEWKEQPLVEVEPGWFVGEIESDEDVILGFVDNAGKPLVPLMAPEPRSIEIDDLEAISITTTVIIDEGLVEFEILPDPQLPGFPHCTLIMESGLQKSLDFRGPGQNGSWRFGLNQSDLAGRSKALRFEMSCVDEFWEQPFTALVRLGEEPTSHSLENNQILVESEAGSLHDAAIFKWSVAAAGSPQWRVVTTIDGYIESAVMKTDELAAKRQELLVPLSAILNLEPHWWPLAGDLWISFDPNMVMAYRGITGEEPLPRQWGLYRGDEAGNWSWLGLTERQGRIGETTARTGYFALMADIEAPRLVNADPADGLKLKNPPVRLRIGVLESGSGFDPRNADILLDGVDQLACWDMDEEILSAEVGSALTSGDYQWEVLVTDRAGNQQRKQFSFTISP